MQGGVWGQQIARGTCPRCRAGFGASRYPGVLVCDAGWGLGPAGSQGYLSTMQGGVWGQQVPRGTCPRCRVGFGASSYPGVLVRDAGWGLGRAATQVYFSVMSCLHDWLSRIVGFGAYTRLPSPVAPSGERFCCSCCSVAIWWRFDFEKCSSCNGHYYFFFF